MKAFYHSHFQCYLGTQTLQYNVFMKATTYTKIALLVQGKLLTLYNYILCIKCSFPLIDKRHVKSIRMESLTTTETGRAYSRGVLSTCRPGDEGAIWSQEFISLCYNSENFNYN